MKFTVSTLTQLALLASSALAHEHHGDPQEYLAAQGPHRDRLWYNTLPGDGGTQVSTTHLPSFPAQLTALPG